MGIDDPDNRVLIEALRRIRKKLVDEIDEMTGTETGDHALSAAILSAVVNVEAIGESAAHSRALVRLTRVLVVLTGVLAGLSAVLAWRTFA